MTANSIPLILASQSPRRRQLLQAAGYAFEVVVPLDSAECGICSRETPPELVARLAWQKAADVAQRSPTPALVLGCDTVAECQGAVLGKPVNRQHASEMLRRMRGREHRVYSGVCLWRRPDNEQLVRVAVTRLVMDPISDTQLERYLDSGGWEGKAGAFGYQDGLDWVHILEGSESNVVGLPMELLAEMFQLMPSPLQTGSKNQKSGEADGD
jgi:septum formation protein